MSIGPRVRGVMRDWGEEDDQCNVLHIDMDAFFAAIEVAHRPELRGKAVIVGGQERSVVLSATYEARGSGVRAAMPMAQARRLCPQAIVVPPQMDRYRDASRQVMAILYEFTPIVEQASVDEAYLDVAGARRRWGSARAIGEQIRSTVSEKLDVTCSVGIGTSKLIAKLGSTHAKPDGLLAIPRKAQVDFIQSLPIGALPGVGGKTNKALQARGITTVRDLATTDPAVIKYWLGNIGSHLYDLAWARDASAVQPHREELSIGAERTLVTDSRDSLELDRMLVGLCEKVAHTLRRRQRSAVTVVLKVKYSDLRTVTRSHTLIGGTDRAEDFVQTARALLAPLLVDREPIRLIGVRAEQLLHTEVVGSQPTLDQAVDESGLLDDKITSVVDGVMGRFGATAVRSASSLDAPTFGSRIP